MACMRYLKTESWIYVPYAQFSRSFWQIHRLVLACVHFTSEPREFYLDIHKTDSDSWKCAHHQILEFNTAGFTIYTSSTLPILHIK